MAALLALALLAPALGALCGVAAATDDGPRRGLQGGSGVAAAAWVVLLAAGEDATWGRFHARPLGAATACGVALLATAVRRPEARAPASAAAAVATLLGAGASAGLGTGSALPLVAAVAAAAAVLVVVARRQGGGGLLSAAAGAAGAALLALGLVRLHGATDSWRLAASADLPATAAALLLAAGAVLALAGGLRPHRDGALLLAVGMAVGLAAAPAVATGSGAEAAVAVVLGAAGVAAAWWRAPALALGLTAVAAAAGPGQPGGAALLLAAAAVLTAALRQPAALLTALPGVAALAVVLVDQHGPGAATATVVGAVALALALRASPSPRLPTRPPGAAVPALAVAAWLVVAPGSWGWVGVGPALDAYQDGAVLALAGALLAVTAGLAWARLPWPAWPGAVAVDPDDGDDPAGARALTTTALVALGVATAVVLAAAVRAG